MALVSLALPIPEKVSRLEKLVAVSPAVTAGSLSVPVWFSPHDKALQAPATPPTFSLASSGELL
jgi:hypothetical protein